VLAFWCFPSAGYIHSAFAFGHESHIYRSTIDGSQIPPGALLSFLQRGLSYVEIEASLRDSRDSSASAAVDTNGTAATLLDVHRILVSHQRTALIPSATNALDAGQNSAVAAANAVLASKSTPAMTGKGPASSHLPEEVRAADSTHGLPNGTHSAHAAEGSDLPNPGVGNAFGTVTGIERVPETEVLALRGHSSEVFCCRWNPRSSLLATGAGDGTARLWAVPQELPASSPGAAAAALTAAASPVVLKMDSDTLCAKTNNAFLSNHCTALEWNSSGSLLVTGSYDGIVRLWSEAGACVKSLARHVGPVLSTRWSPDGTNILSGSVDKTAIVWTPESGKEDGASVSENTYSFRAEVCSHHDGPVLDVDWRSDRSFSLCSTDNTISLWEIGAAEPQHVWRGHRDEVNEIRWSPSGTVLASCSDDFSAMLWTADASEPRQCLREHTKEVLSVRWCTESSSASSSSILATSSYDATIKLWNAETGSCTATLQAHADPVYAIAFSPDGRYLASGSFDRRVLVWSVASNKIVREYVGHGGVFELSWNAAGSRLAASFSNGVTTVLDPRQSAPLTSDADAMHD